MTLEEFNSLIVDAAKNAHLFINDGFSTKRAKSVSVRLDDDGVMSIVMHSEKMPNRVETDESTKLAAHRKAIAALLEREPDLADGFSDFDNYFVHWSDVFEALENAGEDYVDYDESPLDLIEKLVSERDELKSQLEAKDTDQTTG